MSTKSILLYSAAIAASIATFGSLFTMIMLAGSSNAPQKLRTAISVLDEGRWDVAGRIARDLSETIDPETDASWHYVSGVSAVKSIEDRLTTPRSRKILSEATTSLETAAQIGFPTGYAGKGNFYLGWCYFQAYQWQDAVDQLRQIPAQLPSKRSEALRMVVDAQLQLTPPDFSGAKNCLNDWKSIPGMSESEKAKIKLAEAQMAFLQKDPEQCEALLAEIGAELPEYFDALVSRGRWRLAIAKEMQPGDEREQMLATVERLLRKVKIMAGTPSDLRREATLLSARGMLARGKLIEALGTFNSIRQTDPQTAEATVAGVEEAKILLSQADYDGTLATARAVVRNLQDLELYNEKWLTVYDLKRELLDLGHGLRDKRQFVHAIRLAENIAIAFPLADSLRLKSDVYQTWAEHLNAQIEEDPKLEIKHRPRINENYAAAAEGFEHLSKLLLRSPEYTSILWRSIENYREANNLEKANDLLKDYIRFEDRTKVPRGYLAIGKNRMSTGDWQAALEPLQKCLLEYEDHPVSYEARLLAAQAKSELNELDAAIDLLEANTRLYDLRPENSIWRDSLFELGNLVFRQGDQLILDLRLNPGLDWGERKRKLEESQQVFMTAMDRLGEAFSRWPDDPRHHEARYLYARSHRLAAEMPSQALAANPGMIESARRKLLQQRRDLLEKALGQFRGLHQAINQTNEATQAQEKYVSLIRNSYFGEADTLYDLERWEEAIKAYQNVTARFLNQPESLEALVQIAHCYRRLGKETEATQVLNTAQQVLIRIPPESDERFAVVTRGTRDDWTRMIDLMRR